MHLPAPAGDLEHIVAKAIRKDPAERYASAEHFAADIERYLAGFPVEARQPSLAYKAGKYIRRHKAAFVSGAMALLLGIAGVAAIVRQAQIAQRRFDQVRQLAHSIVFELHDGVAPLQGSLPVRKLLVTRALEYLNTLARESQNDRGLTLELAQAFLRIGEVRGHTSRQCSRSWGTGASTPRLSSAGVRRNSCVNDGAQGRTKRTPSAPPELRRTAWTVLAHIDFEQGAYEKSEREYQEVLALTAANTPTCGRPASWTRSR